MIAERLAGGFGRWMLALQLPRRDGVCFCVCVCALSAPVAHSNQRVKKKTLEKKSHPVFPHCRRMSVSCVCVGWLCECVCGGAEGGGLVKQTEKPHMKFNTSTLKLTFLEFFSFFFYKPPTNVVWIKPGGVGFHSVFSLDSLNQIWTRPRWVPCVNKSSTGGKKAKRCICMRE